MLGIWVRSEILNFKAGKQSHRHKNHLLYKRAVKAERPGMDNSGLVEKGGDRMTTECTEIRPPHIT